MSSFPNLQYLKTDWPFFKEHLLLEKSNGNILEIRIYRNQDPIYTKQLIKSIAKYCPRIEKLSIDIEPDNLGGIKEILLNCTRLKIMVLSTNNDGERNCDELLEILANYSPITLCELSFFENWIFTIEGLEKFFENWRKRKPLILINIIVK